MTEFCFLEVLRGHFFCDRHCFKSFYWNTQLKIDKWIKLFCLEFIKKKRYSYLSVCQILVERAKTLEKACDSNSFHSFEVIQIKLATHGTYVDLMCMTFFVRLDTEVPKLCPFFQNSYMCIQRRCFNLPQFSSKQHDFLYFLKLAYRL